MQRVTAESRNRELPGLGRTIRLLQLRWPSQLLNLILTPILREWGGRRRQFDGVFPRERSTQAPLFACSRPSDVQRSTRDEFRSSRMFCGTIEPGWARESRAVKRTRDGAVVYTHPLVTSTFHVQNSIKISLYSQNMLQNIIPQNKSESYCSLRGDETLKLCSSACPRMRSTDNKLIRKSTTRWRQNTANKQLPRMHTVPLGIKDDPIRVPTAVCRPPPPPPHFKGIVNSHVQGKLKHVLQEEISSLLNKRAIRVVLPEQSHNGFYSRYFLVPKKGTQALRPILDLRALNKY